MNGTQRLSGVQLLIASSGLIVWSVAFVVLYATLSVGCAVGLHRHGVVADMNALSLLLALLWLILLAAAGWVQWYGLARRRRDASHGGPLRFLANVTCQVAFVGLLATFLTGLPIVFLPPCT